MKIYDDERRYEDDRREAGRQTSHCMGRVSSRRRLIASRQKPRRKKSEWRREEIAKRWARTGVAFSIIQCAEFLIDAE